MRLEERIVTVKVWNENQHFNDMKINKSYGYVMPLYHGYHWKKTKKELIKIYC